MPAFETTTAFKLVYAFAIADDVHEGLLKVGEATLRTRKLPEDLPPNCEELENAARKRIGGYTTTAAVPVRLLHTELAVRTVKHPATGQVYAIPFRDKDVHAVLGNSGVSRVQPAGSASLEWFQTNLETVRAAIAAVKDGKTAIAGGPVDPGRPTIVLREEQETAVKQTEKAFRTGNRMLWNAKMRFGKTLAALSLVHRARYRRVAIVTHRPVVGGGWREDFGKLFSEKDGYSFLFKSRDPSQPLDDMDSFGNPAIDRANDEALRRADASGDHFIYFASTQDLVGSSRVGGKFEKNRAVFAMDWDLVIQDEAHEGLETERGRRMVAALVKRNTKLLSLSGTPFNILSRFTDDTIYTWDYAQEQRRKAEWDALHGGDSNPYADLPAMHILTYDIGRDLPGFSATDLEGKYFNFDEFFRTWPDESSAGGSSRPDGAAPGDFVHAADVRRFLDLLVRDDEFNNYPFSTERYRNLFRHTFWFLPGVREAAALERMMAGHNVFRHFKVVNVAGDGGSADEDEERANRDALEKVRSAIAGNRFTITLSCGRLTTGVTVPEWTAVFMLAGGSGTSASAYLQTIFRVQSPGSVDGRQKTDCYVFDFAPHRTLKVLAEAADLTEPATRGTRREADSRKVLGDFLKFCPVVAITGSTMQPYDVDALMVHLKHVFAERAVRTGFDDNSLYSDELLRIEDRDVRTFKDLFDIVGRTAPGPKPKDIPVGGGKNGIKETDIETGRRAAGKPAEQWSPEERKALRKYREAKENKRKAIAILRGLSIRMPLMFYGLDVPFDEDVDLNRLVELIDRKSWEEFMPAGLTKKMFGKVSRFYDRDVLVEAGRRIRALAKSADGLRPTERVKQLARIFATFKNPDKETVLTPWGVVNRHLSDTIGGYAFHDESFKEETDAPRWVERGDVSAALFRTPGVKILELNSKSGLYPLYVAYSLFRDRLGRFREEDFTLDALWKMWEDTIRESVFVVCRTAMAQHITRRTLLGYRENAGIVHAKVFPDLVEVLGEEPDKFTRTVKKPSFWGLEGKDEMKIDAIVGNPPYQQSDGGYSASAAPIYHKFVEAAMSLTPRYVTMITPSRWFAGGKGLDEFRAQMLSNHHLRRIVDFPKLYEPFPAVKIRGGISYFLWDRDHDGPCFFQTIEDGKQIGDVVDRYLNEFDVLVRRNEAVPILKKVLSKHEETLSNRISSRKPFGLPTNFHGKKNEEIFGRPVKLYGFQEATWVDRSEVLTNASWIDDWKVLMTAVQGTSAAVETMFLPRPIVAGPGTACTETYLVAGRFATEEEANNYASYLRTRFVRFLVSLRKMTQHATRDVYAFVPDLSYDHPWTDRELYGRYGIDPDEVAFIESVVQEMK